MIDRPMPAPLRRRAAPAAAALSLIAVAAAAGVSCALAAEPGVDQLLQTALAAKADPKHGHVQFDRHCARCHGAGGRGDVNHRVPVLAGQRRAYLVRQLAALSGDQRESANMHRALSVAELHDPQTWADVAAYLEAAPLPPHPRTGDGRALGLGEATFHVECASCHHDDARGDDDGLIPSLRNQHYLYLLSQMRRLAELHRHDMDENIARLLRSLKPDEASAVADYLSRLRGRARDDPPTRDAPP